MTDHLHGNMTGRPTGLVPEGALTKEALDESPDPRSTRVAAALRLKKSGLPAAKRKDLTLIEDRRRRLKQDDREIEMLNYGAGANFDHREGEEMSTGWVSRGVLSEISERASSDFYKAMMLYGLTNRFRPNRAVEMGTCVGISGAYQAMGLRHGAWFRAGRLITLEGSPALADVAGETFSEVGLTNVDVRVGRFVDTLPGVLEEGPVEYAFVDGHHDEDATLEYFEMLAPHSKGGLLIFDDVRWNHRMERAWHAIALDERVELAIDLESYGVVFL